MQKSGRWLRTGSCWCLLVQENDRLCRKAVASVRLAAEGAELVIAGAGLATAAGMSPVQG